jgi:hypothetical protein
MAHGTAPKCRGGESIPFSCSDRMTAAPIGGGGNMSVSINLPGGAIERVSAEDLLWLRLAFPSEWKGTVMVRMTDERLYSVESVAALKAKFASDGAKLAEFTPPDAKLVVIVNAANVRQVDPADPAINPEGAQSVLGFDSNTALAVKETPEEAQSLIDAATRGNV